MLRRILSDESDPRVFGRTLTIENFGGGVEVTLYRGTGVEVDSWTVSSLMLLDASIVEVEPRGIIRVKAVVPRILTAVYEAEEDSLRVAEIEPAALIPG